MRVEIVSTEDRTAWMDAFDRLPEDEKDIHWLPEYVEAHQLDRQGFAHIMDVDGDISLSTFVVKDGAVSSPYGYGGAVGDVFNLVNGRYRFHPFIGYSAGEVEKHVVAIDLEKGPSLSKGHKATARRAEKVCEFVEGQCVGLFADLYRETMQRQHADSKWNLDTDHFVRMFQLLGDHAKLFFVQQKTNLWVESACIVLHGFNAAYYHFAGNRLTQPGASHLMVLRVAEWAQENGYRWLHLGGGVTVDPSDPLLTFKKGFGGELLPVYCYQGGMDGRPH